MKLQIPSTIISLLLASCSTGHWQTATEHHGNTTIIHHRRNTGNGVRIDRIEAVDAKGAYSEAEIKVYEAGRMPDGQGGMNEAHPVYKVVQSPHWNFNLPKHVTGGPRTVYAPPNYVPPTQDQRINDAVDEARQAKKRLDDAADGIQKRLAEDNALKGQLEDVTQQKDELQAKLDASMSTSHKPTEAEKAATDPLAQWGKSTQP